MQHISVRAPSHSHRAHSLDGKHGVAVRVVLKDGFNFLLRKRTCMGKAPPSQTNRVSEHKVEGRPKATCSETGANETNLLQPQLVGQDNFRSLGL